MAPSWVLSLAETVVVEDGDDGELIFSDPYSRFVLRGLGPALSDALRRLAAPGEPDARLAESVFTAEGAATLARWYYSLQTLARRGFLHASVCSDKDHLATLVPIAASFTFTGAPALSDGPYRLSRFAYLHRDGEEIVLESPLAFARLVLHDDRAAALVHALSRPATARDLGRRILGLKASAATQLLGLFVAAGMAAEADEDGTIAEDENAALQCWEFHDLLFHARSRVGRHDAPVGGTYRHAGRLEPPPPLKPFAAAETVELYRPERREPEARRPAVRPRSGRAPLPSRLRLGTDHGSPIG